MNAITVSTLTVIQGHQFDVRIIRTETGWSVITAADGTRMSCRDFKTEKQARKLYDELTWLLRDVKAIL